MIFAMHDPLADLLGEWSRGLNTGSVLLRIALAVLLASVIGCERSSKRHSAGLRTFVLVSFASTVSMLLDVYLMSNFGARLPILSAAGVNTAVIPTALLSTHTGEFTGYTHLDLSDQLSPIAAHLATLGLHFDAFYSGYLASGAQVGQILSMIDLLCDSETHLFVDPAFADHGRRYSLIDETMPAQMRRLCARANTIVPNLTEAAFLLECPYPGEYCSRALIGEYCRGLLDLGTENVIITDVSFSPEETGIALLSRSGRENEPEFLFRSRFDGVFHGTGDVFASFVLAGLLQELPLKAAAERALDLTHESIEWTLREKQPLRYGVQFERVLKKL